MDTAVTWWFAVTLGPGPKVRDISNLGTSSQGSAFSSNLGTFFPRFGKISNLGTRSQGDTVALGYEPWDQKKLFFTLILEKIFLFFSNFFRSSTKKFELLKLSRLNRLRKYPTRDARSAFLSLLSIFRHFYKRKCIKEFHG